MESASTSSRGLSLPTKILIGLLVGATLGVTLNMLYAPPLGGEKTDAWKSLEAFADGVVKPFGDLFLSMLFMVVVPIVFSSLFLGVAGLGSVQKLGSLGGRTLLWFLVTTTAAVLLGIFLVTVIAPGKAVSPEVAAQIKAQYLGDAQARIQQGAQAKGWIQMLVDIVPRNVIGAAADNGKVLGLIFFALVLGAAAIRLPAERTRVLRELLEGIYELCVRVLGWVMQLAPYGVACLIFHATAKLGIDVMKLVGVYFLTAMGGLVFYQLVVITLLAKFFAGIAPGRFYRGCRTLIVTAFSTSSSNATMPTTIRTATEEFGVPKEIAGFVMPLGATMNMNGTALFEGVSILFLAQVYGQDLSLATQAMVVGMAVLTAIGAAGVPGGSLPLLAVVLTQIQVPPELLALILGVDRLVDMTRTIPNVTSDLVCSLWLARREGHVLKA
jgi:DAACS family dicarboxylate/amino acid:cation (Na+ or H+) symporter